MTKLLIVDDNPFYRARLKELFDADGHKVELADCASAAVEIGTEFQPDVLLVDRMLRSGFDGFEVAEVLQSSTPKMKTIVITGYPSAAAERQARESNVFAFFEKPFDPEELLDAVRRAAAGEEPA